MARSGRSPDRAAPGRPGDAVAFAVVASAALLTGWVWAAGEIGAWSGGLRHGHLGLGQTLAAAARLPRTLGHPGRAWPASTGMTALDGRVFWAWATLIGLVAAVLGWWLWRRRGGAGPPTWRGGASGARWASRRDLRSLRARHGTAGRVVIGHPGESRRLLATETRHSLLVLGPTQSGKTTGLALPALLEWEGPVVATSVKDDLAAGSLGWRSRRGPVSVFDPTASTSLPLRSRWSPLSGAASWTAAQRMAAWMVESTPARSGLADAAFWYSAASKQLAPLLLAASLSELGMSDVVRWTDAREFDEPMRLLQLAGEDEATLALQACAERDERIRSSVATTLETVLAPFADPVVAAATAATDVDIESILGERGSLYLCGPSSEQARVQGLFSALVSSVVAAALRRASEAGGTLHPPLLLVLDEVANIAPIRDLDTLASTGAGSGIQLVTVCQDLAQLSARYDPDRARTIANNHRAKLLLSGVADLGTLDLISGLAGEQAVREHTTTQDLTDGRRTRSVATALRRLAPSDELRRTPPGRGVLVYGHLPPVRIRLRPWFADRRLRRRATIQP